MKRRSERAEFAALREARCAAGESYSVSKGT